MTLVETLTNERSEFVFGEIGKAPSESLDEELAREVRELERFVQTLLRRHSSQDLKVDSVIGALFDVH